MLLRCQRVAGTGVITRRYRIVTKYSVVRQALLAESKVLVTAARSSVSIRGGAAQERIDDAPCELLASEQQVVVGGADEQLVRNLRVGVGAQVAAGDTSPEHLPDLGAAQADHALAHESAQLRVARELGREPLDDAAGRRSLEMLARLADQSQQLAACITEVGHRLDACRDVREQLHDQLLLRAPA